MKTREIVLGAAAILCVGALSSAQIAPTGQAAPQPRTQQPRADPTKSPATTLAGCLYRELEDYTLADATPTKEQKPVAGLASGRMYKVTKIDDERLKTLVGKRVEITGTIKPDDDAKPDDSATNTHLPNIEGTSIHEVTGASCPTAPR